MRGFAELYDALDMTTSTNAKVAHLVEYFEEATPEDAAWAVYFLVGRKFKRPVTTTQLREWTYELSGLDEWLFEECYIAVGDLAETIALCLDQTPRPRRSGNEPPRPRRSGNEPPRPRRSGNEPPRPRRSGNEPPRPRRSGNEPPRPRRSGNDLPLHVWVERLQQLRRMTESAQRDAICDWWAQLDRRGIFLLNKLLMGGMRVGVSSGLVTRALAELSGLERPTIQHRLMGKWRPTAEFFQNLLAEDTSDVDLSRPYPYFLASPLGDDLKASPEELQEELGPPEDWQVEWKWDGIRGQLLKRDGQVFLWSRGQELITDRFPELREAARLLPDGVVIDGEILAWREDSPLPFSQLQKRIGRKQVSRRIQQEVPVVFVGYDLLEWEDEDVREEPLEARRRQLEAFFPETHNRFRLSTLVEAPTWQKYARLRADARERDVEGLMLKRRGSPYLSGRKRGDWWKWKAEPYTLDAVMIYAQASHGRRANLYADLTFGVWAEDEEAGEPTLVPIGKAYSGLSDEEIAELDDWIKANTIDRYGPVRSVPAEQVFELAFAGLAPSSRHKSGIALRFPRIKRWRHDKAPEAANTLEEVETLLEAHHGSVEDDEDENGPTQQSLF